MATVVSVLHSGGTKTVVIRKTGQRLLRRTAAVLRDVAGAGGDPFCGTLAKYLETVGRRYAPRERGRS